jgi:ubiquitin carboxyl-terminal hydrolase 36/42
MVHTQTVAAKFGKATMPILPTALPRRSQETTLVHHVFGGYLRSQVECGGCGAASRRYEAALDLQLEVPAGVDRLEDVLLRVTAGARFAWNLAFKWLT